MSTLHDGLLGAMLGGTPSTKYDVLSYQQQAMVDILGQQRYMAGMAQAQHQRPFSSAGCIPTNYTSPPRKKVESKIIETVEIRLEQDIKLLKAGKGI